MNSSFSDIISTPKATDVRRGSFLDIENDWSVVKTFHRVDHLVHELRRAQTTWKETFLKIIAQRPLYNDNYLQTPWNINDLPYRLMHLIIDLTLSFYQSFADLVLHRPVFCPKVKHVLVVTETADQSGKS